MSHCEVFPTFSSLAINTLPLDVFIYSLHFTHWRLIFLPFDFANCPLILLPLAALYLFSIFIDFDNCRLISLPLAASYLFTPITAVWYSLRSPPFDMQSIFIHSHCCCLVFIHSYLFLPCHLLLWNIYCQSLTFDLLSDIYSYICALGNDILLAVPRLIYCTVFLHWLNFISTVKHVILLPAVGSGGVWYLFI